MLKNIEFDINMIKIELLRNIYHTIDSPQQLRLYKHNLHYLTNFPNIYCTLKETILFCNIRLISKSGVPYLNLKYPKLIELHEKLFQTIPTNLHNSFNDILVTLRCFMKFKHNIDLLYTCKAFKKFSKQIVL